MNKQFQRILMIKLRFHGDMLLTTPVISSLKRRYPGAEIDMLLYEDTIPVLSENPEISRFWGVKNRKAGITAKFKNFFWLIKSLRAKRYDAVINLTDQWIIALLVRMLSADVKLSQDYAHRQSSFWKNSFTHLAPFAGEHVVERNLSVLTPLGIEEKDIYRETTMHYKPEHWLQLQTQLSALGVTNRYVVIQPTARQLFKCWDNEKFSAVIDALESGGYRVILTSGPDMGDLLTIRQIAAGCRIKPVTEFAGKTTFPELAALIAHAELFIGLDSAPGHIAAAVKTPVICLFGATDHRYWRPWSDNVTQFWAGNYQKMPERKDLDRHRKYLSVIPASDIIAATQKWLPGMSEAQQEVVH